MQNLKGFETRYKLTWNISIFRLFMDILCIERLDSPPTYPCSNP